MSAEWKRAPLPEGHEEEGLLHDGSNGMGRVLLAGLAVGAVGATLYYVDASEKWDRTDAELEAHRHRAEGAPATGTVHVKKVELDVEIGDLGWQFHDTLRGGGFYLASNNGEPTANIDFGSIERADAATTDGLIADLRQHWDAAGDDVCQASDARSGQPAIYCNDDPTHVWAWADGDWLIYAVYGYDHADTQPDFVEIQRIVASAR